MLLGGRLHPSIDPLLVVPPLPVCLQRAAEESVLSIQSLSDLGYWHTFSSSQQEFLHAEQKRKWLLNFQEVNDCHNRQELLCGVVSVLWGHLRSFQACPRGGKAGPCWSRAQLQPLCHPLRWARLTACQPSQQEAERVLCTGTCPGRLQAQQAIRNASSANRRRCQRSSSMILDACQLWLCHCGDLPDRPADP